MSDSYKNIKSHIIKILKIMNNNLTSNISHYSHTFHISYHHLYHRKHDRNSHSTQSVTNWKLTEIQKKAVLDYMTQMDELFMLLTLSLIKSTANLILHITHNDSSETAPQIDKH